MRRLENRTIILVTGFVLGGGWCATLAEGSWRTVGAGGTSVGFRPPEVASMSEQICLRACPGTRYRAFSVEINGSVPAGGDAIAACTAFVNTDGSDSPSNAYLRWNAATGKLIAVSREMRPGEGRRNPIPAREAARRCARWLHILGRAPPNAQIALDGPPESNRTAWVVHFRIGRRPAVVRIRLDGEKLQSAELRG
ncbi:MAG TPA: hypothetical protein VKT77_20725 [Chthonomonadaceae bacterium]|nr:hypothetical protein [Chthonomonadaceae bacterium]